MKVHIGKYVDWTGPFQIAEALFFWVPKVKDEFGYDVFPEWVFDIGEKLSNTWVYDVCDWIYQRRERKVKVKIHNYDVWNAEHSLALVILPVLKRFKEAKRYTTPVIGDTACISIDGETKEEEEKRHKDWEDILDKMIWSFEQIVDDETEDQFWIQEPDFSDCGNIDEMLDKVNRRATGGRFDYTALEKHNEKIQEGLDLFGKHFRSLWD